MHASFAFGGNQPERSVHPVNKINEFVSAVAPTALPLATIFQTKSFAQCQCTSGGEHMRSSSPVTANVSIAEASKRNKIRNRSKIRYLFYRQKKTSEKSLQNHMSKSSGKSRTKVATDAEREIGGEEGTSRKTSMEMKSINQRFS